VYAFWRADVEVPEHVGICRVCDGMSLVRAIQGRKLDWVANEEDGLIVKYSAIVSFGSLELDSPSMEVSDGIG
jgi:hypothetical protein